MSASACWTGSKTPHDTPVRHEISNQGSAQPDGDGVEIPAPKTGFASLGGICTDAQTGSPLGDVMVILYRLDASGNRNGGMSAISDARGHYALGDVRPGSYEVQFKMKTDPGRMAPESHRIELQAGDMKRLDGAATNQDWSNIPMPYGAPPQRRRVV